ncbi:hypothetical protein ACFXK0_25805 [Nocardia sp. NPDC059177]|uniref:hypothetical protein n=1 Tax=Nocardia sp. NPDC059177 TaxID=3346759 RepID=UPI0036C9CC6A
MRLQTSVGAWVDMAVDDWQAVGELAREVQAAVLVHQRQMWRAAAATAARDLVWEGCSMAYDIADLADAARRARSDRLRADARRRSAESGRVR